MLRWLPVAMLLLAPFAPASAAEQPNILFVLIDDLGWSDLACQGNKLVETPHLDRLATQGVRFTDAYAISPVCSPTRAGLITGLHPARLHLTNHVPDRPRYRPKTALLLSAPMVDRLPLEQVTVAERLREAGYATGFFGKWHLSGSPEDPKLRPEFQGFDVNVGGCNFGGPPTFFDPYRIPTIENRRKGEYLPDRLADEAIDFMQKSRGHDGKPFAVFLWNYTVHWPMEAPEPLLEKYADRKGPGLNDTRYGAMIEAMDAAVGRVLAELDRLKVADETLVVFTSDNGGFAGVSDNRPLRAAKGHLYEGGIRVPLVVRWPGHVKAGTVEATPVSSLDLSATFLEVGGTSADGLDGESLVPLLEGRDRERLAERPLYFHFPNYAWHGGNRLGSAVRFGDYKLIERFDDGSLELFDLRDDLGERKNLAEAEPERAAAMLSRLRQWREDLKANMPTPVEE